MVYLTENDLKQIGINWHETVNVIENAVNCLAKEEFAQPVKPYLRYGELKNRIIAMPAFIGGDIDMAGIKWIASFPDNIHKNIPRAHSVVILNNADTGEPVAIINTALLSIIRTASVSGLIAKYFDKVRPLKSFNLGIIGWGPIGRHHYRIFNSLFGDRISKVFLYDLRPIINKDDPDFPDKDRVVVAESWEEVYDNSDVFITCTVSKEPYIDRAPKKCSLQLNVSLRDYKTDIFGFVKKAIIVDDWDEVCREKTDIEMLHFDKGLQKEETKSIIDVVCNNCMTEFPEDQAIMFNPMGMAVFDIAMGAYYMKKANELGIGTSLL